MKKYFVLSLAVFAFILSASLAFALDGATSTPNTLSKLAVDIACVKSAMEKREDAIQSAFDAFYASYKGALQMRKSDLSAAWTVTDKKARRLAIEKAWLKFKRSRLEAGTAYNAARKAVWAQFTLDRKACGSPATGENPGTDTL